MKNYNRYRPPQAIHKATRNRKVVAFCLKNIKQDKENATNSIFDIGSKRDTRFLFNGKKYTKLVKRNVRVGILQERK